MRRDQTDLALAAGHTWAELKAEVLRDTLAAAEWPEFPLDADDIALPFSEGEVSDQEWTALTSVAAYAAQERWMQLVEEQRALEGPEQELMTEEIEAAALEEELRATLSDAFVVTRDSSRVFLKSLDTGVEESVASLEQAWRVVSDWQEQLVTHHQNLE